MWAIWLMLKSSQRRFAPTLAHITGITGPHHWNTQTGVNGVGIFVDTGSIHPCFIC